MAAAAGAENIAAAAHLFRDTSRGIYNGLQAFLNDPRLSDIVLVRPDGRALHVHQIILAACSRKFATVLANGDATGKELPIQGVDSAALESVVSFFYRGECLLSPTTVVPILDVCLKLEVPGLLAACEQYIQQNLNPHTCSLFLAAAVPLTLEQTVKQCISYAKSRFDDVVSTSAFQSLSSEAMRLLLTNTRPAVGDVAMARALARWAFRQPEHLAECEALLKELNVTATALLQLLQLPDFVMELRGPAADPAGGAAGSGGSGGGGQKGSGVGGGSSIQAAGADTVNEAISGGAITRSGPRPSASGSGAGGGGAPTGSGPGGRFSALARDPSLSSKPTSAAEAVVMAAATTGQHALLGSMATQQEQALTGPLGVRQSPTAAESDVGGRRSDDGASAARAAPGAGRYPPSWDALPLSLADRAATGAGIAGAPVSRLTGGEAVARAGGPAGRGAGLAGPQSHHQQHPPPPPPSFQRRSWPLLGQPQVPLGSAAAAAGKSTAGGLVPLHDRESEGSEGGERAGGAAGRLEDGPEVGVARRRGPAGLLPSPAAPGSGGVLELSRPAGSLLEAAIPVSGAGGEDMVALPLSSLEAAGLTVQLMPSGTLAATGGVLGSRQLPLQVVTAGAGSQAPLLALLPAQLLAQLQVAALQDAAVGAAAGEEPGSDWGRLAQPLDVGERLPEGLQAPVLQLLQQQQQQQQQQQRVKSLLQRGLTDRPPPTAAEAATAAGHPSASGGGRGGAATSTGATLSFAAGERMPVPVLRRSGEAGPPPLGSPGEALDTDYMDLKVLSELASSVQQRLSTTGRTPGPGTGGSAAAALLAGLAAPSASGNSGASGPATGGGGAGPGAPGTTAAAAAVAAAAAAGGNPRRAGGGSGAGGGGLTMSGTSGAAAGGVSGLVLQRGRSGPLTGAAPGAAGPAGVVPVLPLNVGLSGDSGGSRWSLLGGPQAPAGNGKPGGGAGKRRRPSPPDHDRDDPDHVEDASARGGGGGAGASGGGGRGGRSGPGGRSAEGGGSGPAGSKPALVCHVDDCHVELSNLKEYHQRFRICDFHLKAEVVMRDGMPQRFCQQCGRFHMLTEFDGAKRSCRARLQRHNARRRKRPDQQRGSGGDGGSDEPRKPHRTAPGSSPSSAARQAGGNAAFHHHQQQQLLLQMAAQQQQQPQGTPMASPPYREDTPLDDQADHGAAVAAAESLQQLQQELALMQQTRQQQQQRVEQLQQLPFSQREARLEMASADSTRRLVAAGAGAGSLGRAVQELGRLAGKGEEGDALQGEPRTARMDQSPPSPSPPQQQQRPLQASQQPSLRQPVQDVQLKIEQDEEEGDAAARQTTQLLQLQQQWLRQRMAGEGAMVAATAAAAARGGGGAGDSGQEGGPGSQEADGCGRVTIPAAAGRPVSESGGSGPQAQQRGCSGVAAPPPSGPGSGSRDSRTSSGHGSETRTVSRVVSEGNPRGEAPGS